MSDGSRYDTDSTAAGNKRYSRALLILWRSALGGALVMVPGTLGYITGNLWLFPSLGPSIFLLIISPHHKTARAYNTFAGHMIAIACGYFAVLAMGVSGVPPALPMHHLLVPHVAAAGLAVTLMLVLQLSLKAAHPSGAATALLIALGTFKPTWQDCLLLITGVAIMTIAGEAARRLLIWKEPDVAEL